MSKLTPEKRKKIEKLVLDVMGALDPTGINAKQYKKHFASMSETQMVAWLEELKTNEDAHLYATAIPYKNEMTLASIEAAAKVSGTMLHQYVTFRHEGVDGKPIRTRHRVPVGYVHIRRLQQIVSKKTSFSTDVTKRSQITGQLSEHEKSRLADEETYALKTVGAEPVLAELLGPRADNRGKRLGMYGAIERDGFVRLGDLKGDLKDQGTLNYFDVLITAAGLRSDLVDQGDLLRVTIDRPSQ